MKVLLVAEKSAAIKCFRTNVCVIFFSLCFYKGFSQHNQIAERVKPIALQLFSLQDVRLLESPFKHIEDLDHKYLLELNPDKLASWFRREAGLTPKAQPYPSWESENVTSTSALPGHIMGFYLSAMSMMYASTGDEAIREKLRYTIDQLYECQQANGNGYLLPTVNGKHTFEDVAAGNFTTQNPTINDAFEPTYVMNKIMLGLYAVYTACNIERAKDIDIAMADWFGMQVIDKLSHDQMQKLLYCEHGSLNESFVQVYQITDNKKYLSWAKRLTDEMIFTPLSKNDVNVLTGQHANTNIPKFTGYENVYNYTGDNNYHAAAVNFWNAVTRSRSWANGGNSMDEHFFTPQNFEEELLHIGGPESCNSVNMMRLTERLYQDAPTSEMTNYYEKVLFNHILANYNPENGQCVYYTTMRPGGYKVYGIPLKSFWCCNGTGLEAPAKFGDMIYAHDASNIYVNLFIPSQVKWQEKGLTLVQKTSIPQDNTSAFVFTLNKPQTFSLFVRMPDWLAGKMKVWVNGKEQSYTNHDGYAVINKIWNNGDVVKAELPMELRAAPLPYSNSYVSFQYGPVLMASRVDNHGLTKSDFSQQNTTIATKTIPVEEAPYIIGETANLASGFTRIKDSVVHFINKAQNISLFPYSSIHFSRYTIYFKRYENDAAYASLAKAIRDSLQTEKKQNAELDAITVDRVIMGDNVSEEKHHFEGVNSNSGDYPKAWRDAANGGYFMYSLKLPETGEAKLYLVFLAQDNGERVFDVLVDGKLITTFDHSQQITGKTGLYGETVLLPVELTQGKPYITIKFEARNRNTAGGIFDVRIIK